MNFPCVYVVEQYGLRVGIIGGIVSTALGLWTRCLLSKSIYFALLGQVIMALGQPLMYNSPAKVTTNWFKEKERPMATMIGTQMNIFGIFVGFLIPNLFIDDYNSSVILTPAVRDMYEGQLFNMNAFAASVATVIAILVVVSFREKPGRPLFSNPRTNGQYTALTMGRL